MGRAPCCEKIGMKKGRWTAEEDELLIKYISVHGEGSWRSMPKNAGLLRCGKSCRLRWINYLRSDLKRGNITPEEEDTITKLHSSLGNRWSDIAGHLPGRTDNEIKNYWNSHLSRRIHTFDDSLGEVDLGRVSSSRKGGSGSGSGRLSKSVLTRKEDNDVHNKLDEHVRMHDKLSTQSEGGGESMVVDSDPTQQQASSVNFAAQQEHDMLELVMRELEDPCVGLLLSPTSGLVAETETESELWCTSDIRASTTTASKGMEVVNEEVGETKLAAAAAALDGDWGGTNEGEVAKWLHEWEILDRQCKLWDDDGSNMGELMWPWADQEGSSTVTGYQLEEGTVESWPYSDVL